MPTPKPPPQLTRHATVSARHNALSTLCPVVARLPCLAESSVRVALQVSKLPLHYSGDRGTSPDVVELLLNANQHATNAPDKVTYA